MFRNYRHYKMLSPVLVRPGPESQVTNQSVPLAPQRFSSCLESNQDLAIPKFPRNASERKDDQLGAEVDGLPAQGGQQGCSGGQQRGGHCDG